MRAFLAMVTLCLCVLPAQAHQESEAFLNLTRADGAVTGTIDLAQQDLEIAVGQDFSESYPKEVIQYIRNGLSFQAADQSCALTLGEPTQQTRIGLPYISFPLRAACLEVGPVDMRYDLIFDISTRHLARVQILNTGAPIVQTISSESRVVRVGQGGTPARSFFVEAVWQGVIHILKGFDHVLFLIALLLPAALVRRDGSWQPAGSLPQILRRTAGIVTAFTLAHSLTLALAATGVVLPPARLVESTIAVTLILAALNNIRPLVSGHIWMLAFGFGLIHGFGFANVMAELDFSAGSFALGLLAFNLGVEVGQLALVLLLLPMLYALRHRASFRDRLMPGASAIAGLLATVWLVERAWDVRILPAL
ncbi:MAG: HupE/UreJ family protein [Pseudomonadota bacterium]